MMVCVVPRLGSARGVRGSPREALTRAKARVEIIDYGCYRREIDAVDAELGTVEDPAP
jgi:hypothetical protein